MSDDTISFRDLGFLRAFPGREYRTGDDTMGHVLRAVGLRLLGDEVVEAANAQGLHLEAHFDDAHPDFVLLETFDEQEPIARLAAALDGLGYHRLAPIEAAVPELEAPAPRYNRSIPIPPAVDLDSLPDPMTDEEVARFLRRPNKQSVQRLRLSGALPFRPGRPPLITKADLLAYLESAKVRNEATPRKPLAAETKQAERERSIAEARAWAIKMLNKPKRAPRRKPA